MKTYAPNYYTTFSCIAGKCRHSCCVGWEIDVDDETWNTYSELNSDFGRRIRESIVCESECRHFELSENERCPFLRDDNLCDIIINLGEDALCAICSDHPRFRNFFSGRTEIGLGMCCEAAAELILKQEEKVCFECIADDGTDEILTEEDKIFFNMRQKYLDILQNRNLDLDQRFNLLMENAGVSLEAKSVDEWAQVYLNLEHLDPGWAELLKKLQKREKIPPVIPSGWETELEQLVVYFIIRHLADGRDDVTVPERVCFSVLSTLMVATIALLCFENPGFDTLKECARMYSAEIEYSEENTDALIDMISEYNYEINKKI